MLFLDRLFPSWLSSNPALSFLIQLSQFFRVAAFCLSFLSFINLIFIHFVFRPASVTVRRILTLCRLCLRRHLGHIVLFFRLRLVRYHYDHSVASMEAMGWTWCFRFSGSVLETWFAGHSPPRQERVFKESNNLPRWDTALVKSTISSCDGLARRAWGLRAYSLTVQLAVLGPKIHFETREGERQKLFGGLPYVTLLSRRSRNHRKE